MSRAARKLRANAGDTEARAIEAISKLESLQVDWGPRELAAAIDISLQHARNIIMRMTYRGALQYADVVVKKRRLVLQPVSA